MGTPQPTAPASPYVTGSNDLVQLTIEQLYGDISPDMITRDVAQRVPGFKRAVALHAGIVASIPFKQYTGPAALDPQPAWLTSSASGVSPYHRMFGVTTDLFWYGWALLGAEKGPDERPIDAMHIPYGMWSVTSDGEIKIDDSIEARFRELPIAIHLGLNGVLVDGIDTIRAARFVEKGWAERALNPIAQTELHINNPDTQLSKKEQRALAKEYNEQRRLSSTSVTPYDIDVKEHGQVSTDFFESGRNAVRLDIANHGYVPASIIEGAKNGSAGEINYSNDAGKRNELYDFGSALFVNAIAARLSLDDVCAPGDSIRPDLSWAQAVPTPTTSLVTED